MDRLGADLEVLVRRLGPRHLDGREQALTEAAAWLERSLTEVGLNPHRERFQVGAVEVCNVLAEPSGAPPEAPVLIVGAHYDTVPGSPGANDNGSGVVAVLELARRFARRPTRTRLRFVLFVNEEAPWFMSPAMGSLVHARGCRRREERLLGMLCLESVGVYIDIPGSQRYPSPLERIYPNRGDFVAFVGNLASRGLLRRSIRNFRDAWYHRPLDRPGNLDLESMARLVDGLEAVILDRVDQVRPRRDRGR